MRSNRKNVFAALAFRRQFQPVVQGIGIGFSHAWRECYVPLASGSMSILLSTDWLVERYGLSGLGCDAYFRGLLCRRLRWVNVFDARVRETHRTHLLRSAGRCPAKQHRRNPDCPEPQRFGYREFEMIHRRCPFLCEILRGWWHRLPALSGACIRRRTRVHNE